jgi:hypothetical protein
MAAMGVDAVATYAATSIASVAGRLGGLCRQRLPRDPDGALGG